MMKQRSLLGLAVLLIATPILGSCTSLSDRNQVVIHGDDALDEIAAARREADQVCATRGLRARFVMRENDPRGQGQYAGPADAIYECF